MSLDVPDNVKDKYNLVNISDYMDLGETRLGSGNPLADGGDGGMSGLEPRVAKLEAHVEAIRDDVKEIKLDIKLLSQQQAEFKSELLLQKADFQSELGQHQLEFRSELAQHQLDVRSELAQHQSEFRSELAQHRENIDSRLTELRTDLVTFKTVVEARLKTVPARWEAIGIAILMISAISAVIIYQEQIKTFLK